jgi:hypothetical protein
MFFRGAQKWAFPVSRTRETRIQLLYPALHDGWQFIGKSAEVRLYVFPKTVFLTFEVADPIFEGLTPLLQSIDFAPASELGNAVHMLPPQPQRSDPIRQFLQAPMGCDMPSFPWQFSGSTLSVVF